MDIKYKIIEVHPQDHVIVVRFYTDKFTEASLTMSDHKREDGTPARCRTDMSLSIPIPEPSEEELHKLILTYCPVSFFETQEKIKDPNIDTSMSSIAAKLNQVIVVNEEEIKNTVNTVKVLSDSDVQQLLEQLK